MVNIFQGVFFGFLALLIAVVEIESEGRYGWAQKAPTWYRKTKWFQPGKPMTGYHVALIPTFFLLFHIPFAFGMEWTLKTEAAALSVYAVWILIEDYLWFVLNPYYGIAGMKKAWWHDFRFIPEGMWIMVVLSVGTGIFSGWEIYRGRLIGLIIVILLAIIVGRPLFVRYYNKMREPGKDDRDKYPIIKD